MIEIIHLLYSNTSKTSSCVELHFHYGRFHSHLICIHGISRESSDCDAAGIFRSLRVQSTHQRHVYLAAVVPRHLEPDHSTTCRLIASTLFCLRLIVRAVEELKRTKQTNFMIIFARRGRRSSREKEKGNKKRESENGSNKHIRLHDNLTQLRGIKPRKWK